MALKARNLYLDLDLRKGEACGSTTEDLGASVGKWNHEVAFKKPSFLATADPYKAKATSCKQKHDSLSGLYGWRVTQLYEFWSLFKGARVFKILFIWRSKTSILKAGFCLAL